MFITLGIIQYEKFSEKLTFLPPDTRTYFCISGGNECLRMNQIDHLLQNYYWRTSSGFIFCGSYFWL